MSEYKLMLIDTAAGTPIQSYNGDAATLDMLKYDISSFVHYVQTQGSTLIIGSGGGRDVLAAIAFGKRDIISVEINPIIVETVRGKYGEFSGHVYDLPGVQVVADEARNTIARSSRRYDIIQASLIDTWAATSAGGVCSFRKQSVHARSVRHLLSAPDG
jgi:predicted membrane-bound spermidine synthase